MERTSQPCLGLDELSWIDVAAQVAHDPRLIIPVGALEQHGPHLPLGSNALIAQRLAFDLSTEFSVLRAPTFHYGVTVSADRVYAGTAAVSKKVLHRALNDLLACWEEQGLREFILITAHRHEPHLEALAALVTNQARVRVVQAWDVDVADLLTEQHGLGHGGEAETSILLHLYPDLVRMERARDFDLEPSQFERYLHGGLPAPPAGSAGSVGRPSAASAEKGRAIYERILEAIRRSVFTAPSADDTDTL